MVTSRKHCDWMIFTWCSKEMIFFTGVEFWNRVARAPIKLQDFVLPGERSAKSACWGHKKPLSGQIDGWSNRYSERRRADWITYRNSRKRWFGTMNYSDEWVVLGFVNPGWIKESRKGSRNTLAIFIGACPVWVSSMLGARPPKHLFPMPPVVCRNCLILVPRLHIPDCRP